MANSQTKEDKVRFFTDLERLCESESEDNQEESSWAVKLELLTLPQIEPLISTRSSGQNEQDITRRSLQTRSSRTSPAVSAHITNVEHTAEVVDLISPRCAMATTPKTKQPVLPLCRLGAKRVHTGDCKSQPRLTSKNHKKDVQLVPERNRVFKGLVFFFIPNDDVARSRKIRIRRAEEYGAQWARKFDDTVTHVIVEHDISYCEALKAFPNHSMPENVQLVRSTWLSESLVNMHLRDVHQSRFRLVGELKISPKPRTPSPKMSRKRKNGVIEAPEQTATHARTPRSTTPGKLDVAEEDQELKDILDQVKTTGSLPLDSDAEEGDSFASCVSDTSFESDFAANSAIQKSPPMVNKGFQCMDANNGTNHDNPNSRTVGVLQEMATYYDRTGDHWRTAAYRKAITALRKQTELVSTYAQALAVPQIGSRVANKIEEIVVTNRLRRLESTKDDPHAEVLQLFMGIYGVGYKQASQWIAQGHRKLKDLVEKASLSDNQRIGISHYDDFQQRIPRSEISQHASIVRRSCQAIDKDLEVVIGGSYRRGSPDSGDIDLLIIKHSASLSNIRTLMMSHVIPALTNAGFLKCALASSQRSSSTGSKWHGASCLPRSTIWRRIDLLFVPGDELGAALLYFTGNDIFNRSIRLLASKKGMRLNQHGLYKDVMRGQGRTNLTEGTLIEAQNERKIFEILGVPWREPWERKC